MANITVTVTEPSISANIETSTVTVTEATTNVILSETSVVSNSAVRAALSNISPILYNVTTGVISFDSNASFAAKTTDDLAEGNVNLYYTNARVNAYIVDNGLDFNATKVQDEIREFGSGVIDNGSVSGNVTLDLAAGLTHYIELTGNIDTINLANAKANGDSVTILVQQDSVGGHQLVGNIISDWNFVNGITTLDINSSANTVISVIYDGSDYKASIVDFVEDSALETTDDLTEGLNNLYLNGSGTTDDLTEGSSNLYFTNARATSAIVSANLDFTGEKVEDHVAYLLRDQRVNVPDVGYSNANVQFAWSDLADKIVFYHNLTTDDITEGNNLYYTDARVQAYLTSQNIGANANVESVNGQTGVVVLDTGDIAENGNLYFTTARANTAIVDYLGGNDITIGGNLEVQGNIDYVNVVDLQVEDNKIILNYGNASARDAQIIVDRSGSALSNVEIRWNEIDDRWEFTDAGNVYIMPRSTTDLPEGSNLYYTDTRFDTRFSTKDTGDLTEGTNLYYTDARARGAVSAAGDLTYNASTGVFSVTTYKTADFNTDFATKTTTDLAEGTNLYYTQGRFDSAFAAKTTDDLTEGNVNLYYTDSRARAAISATGNILYDANTGVISESLTTTDIEEGDNLYYTDARARAAISATGNILYDANTGVISESLTTTDIEEGDNLYYTDARVETYMSSGLSTVIADTVQANAFTGGTFTGDGSDLTDVRAKTVEEKVINKSGGLLPKGTPVFATGNVTADALWVDACDASNAATMPCIGVLATDLAIDAEGSAIVVGAISGVDTSLFQPGEEIFVAVGGGYANVAPAGEANIIQHLGVVTRSDAIVGGGVVSLQAPRNQSNLNDGNIFIGDASNVTTTAVLDTSIVPENGNLYYTDARARAAISATGNILYDANTGVISEALTTDDVDEGTNLYFTDERVDDRVANLLQTTGNLAFTYDDANGALTLSESLTTDDIDEGTNLYYTDARSRAAISSGDTNIEYEANTGVIGLANALTNVNSISAESNTDLSLKGFKINIQSEVNGGSATYENVINVSTSGYAVITADADAELNSHLANSLYPAGVLLFANSNAPTFSVTEGSNVITVNAGTFGLRLDTFGFIAPSGNIETIFKPNQQILSTYNNSFYEFSKTAYITSVTSFGNFAGGTITMSEPAVRSGNSSVITPSGFNSRIFSFEAGRDTNTDQIIWLNTASSLGGNIFIPFYTYEYVEAGWSNTTFTFGNTAISGGFTNQTTQQIANFSTSNGAARFDRAVLIGQDTGPGRLGEESTIGPSIVGMNIVNDGTIDLSDSIGRQPIQQLYLKQWDDNSPRVGGLRQTGLSNLTVYEQSLAAPRLNFESANANINADLVDQYVRSNNVIGSIVWDGPGQEDNFPEDFIKPGAIHYRAEGDWTDRRIGGFYFQNQPTESDDLNNGPRTWLKNVDGNTTIQTTANGVFSVAPITTHTTGENALKIDMEDGQRFVDIGYADPANEKGSLVNVQPEITIKYDLANIITNVNNIANISNDQANTTVTVTTSVDHGYTDGDSVIIGNVDPADYNGTYTIANASGNTFTYTANISNAYVGNGNVATSTLTFNTSSPHRFASGDTVRVGGVDPTDYNGTYTITVVNDTSFTAANPNVFDGFTANGFVSYPITPGNAQIKMSVHDANGNVAASYDHIVRSDSGDYIIQDRNSNTVFQVSYVDSSVSLGFQLKLASYANTTLANLSSTAGGVAYDSTNNKPAYYNGTNWVYFDDNSTV